MKMIIMARSGDKVATINRRKAVREKCLICSDWSAQEVAECPHTDCPLYRFRLGRGTQNTRERNRAIHRYCLWCMAGNKAEIAKCVSLTCPLYPY
jgi:hypothetical protein